MIIWNLVHGCHRKSEGCKHCYVFTRDEENGVDTNLVRKTASFNLPLRRNQKGEWKIPSGTEVMTCFSSDFFLPEMDAWREEAWEMMRFRRDLRFYMVTKRPERTLQCLPAFWNEIKERITICCTMENQRRVDERLPVLLSLPLPHKEIIVEPMLGPVDFHGNLEDIACVTLVASREKMPVPAATNGCLVCGGSVSTLAYIFISCRLAHASSRTARPTV